MEPLDAGKYAADGLIESYERLMAMAEKVGPDKVGAPMMCAIATVKVALLAFADAQNPALIRAFEKGEEQMHAGDALVQVGCACTAAAMVLHARLSVVQPRSLSVQRAGAMAADLMKLAGQLTKAGYHMSDAAEKAGQGSHGKAARRPLDA